MIMQAFFTMLKRDVDLYKYKNILICDNLEYKI